MATHRQISGSLTGHARAVSSVVFSPDGKAGRGIGRKPEVKRAPEEVRSPVVMGWLAVRPVEHQRVQVPVGTSDRATAATAALSAMAMAIVRESQ